MRSVKGDIRRIRRDLQKAGAILPEDWVTLIMADGTSQRIDGFEALPVVLNNDVVEVIGDGEAAAACWALM